MSYAIIGFGKIGHALARAFARKGIEVSVATTRDPASLAADAAAIGPKIIPTTLAEAAKADSRLSGGPLRVAPGGREGATHLGGKDHRRCDEHAGPGRGTGRPPVLCHRREGVQWRPGW